MNLNPGTELTLAVMHYETADVVTLPERAKRLAAAGTAYLEAEAAGKTPPREKRRYTNQLAYAAQATGAQATRPHERDLAIEQLLEIYGHAKAELAAERDTLKKAAQTAPVEAQPLNENRYDVQQGLLG